MIDNTSQPQNQFDEIRREWDEAAAAFDEQPDHGLRDPRVRAAWMDLLRHTLPPGAGSVLDLGCGTGSLSLLMAQLGYSVTGIDFSPRMIELAREKAAAAGAAIDFHIMDAAAPRFPARAFDVLVCRHLLWALPEPALVLERWAALLKPAGRLLLIEGFWSTGAGLHAGEILAALPYGFTGAVQDLSRQEALWGGPMTDERYLVVAQPV
jgi:2-polyprenyl-3-methyl-5-hydroxy-6-metoxy-1,4-benzoquinol methylase